MKFLHHLACIIFIIKFYLALYVILLYFLNSLLPFYVHKTEFDIYFIILQLIAFIIHFINERLQIVNIIKIFSYSSIAHFTTKHQN